MDSIDTLSHRVKGRLRTSASANPIGSSTEGAPHSNAQRVTKGEPLLHFWGKPPIDTFRSYDYYRLPSISFV
jgi:hypothetical protein